MSASTIHQHARYDLCTPDMVIGWKLVRPDFTTSNGYQWAFPGSWNVPHNENGVPFDGKFTKGGDGCPSFNGDGLCVAINPRGASSGGIVLGRSCILVVGYYEKDVLARCEPHGKLRVKRALSLDVWDFDALLRVARANLAGANLADANLARANLAGAYLAGANLARANLAGANLAGARYDESTGLPSGFDPKAAGMVRL